MTRDLFSPYLIKKTFFPPWKFTVCITLWAHLLGLQQAGKLVHKQLMQFCLFAPFRFAHQRTFFRDLRGTLDLASHADPDLLFQAAAAGECVAKGPPRNAAGNHLFSALFSQCEYTVRADCFPVYCEFWKKRHVFFSKCVITSDTSHAVISLQVYFSFSHICKCKANNVQNISVPATAEARESLFADFSCYRKSLLWQERQNLSRTRSSRSSF